MRQYEVLSFTKVYLTELQESQGRSLNSVQRDVIQNSRANLAEEILAKTYSYDVNNPLDYGTELAYLQGQLDALTNLINLSDAATHFIVSVANQEAEANLTESINPFNTTEE
jgi:hypothetical protein